MARAFRFIASIGPFQSQTWWTGGGDWYSTDHFPQFDVRPRPVPGIFLDDGNSPALTYKDFACSIRDTFPYHANYYLTVVNNSNRTIPYEMRVWVP